MDKEEPSEQARECPYCKKLLRTPQEIFQHLTRRICQDDELGQKERIAIQKKLREEIEDQ